MAKVFTGGMPGGAVGGQDKFMQVMEQTGDADHDRFERVSHSGTFNANPYCAATGNAALSIVATGEMQDQADRMATRLRTGLSGVVQPLRSTGDGVWRCVHVPRVCWRPLHRRA